LAVGRRNRLGMKKESRHATSTKQSSLYMCLFPTPLVSN